VHTHTRVHASRAVHASIHTYIHVHTHMPTSGAPPLQGVPSPSLPLPHPRRHPHFTGRHAWKPDLTELLSHTLHTQNTRAPVRCTHTHTHTHARTHVCMKSLSIHTSTCRAHGGIRATPVTELTGLYARGPPCTFQRFRVRTLRARLGHRQSEKEKNGCLISLSLGSCIPRVIFCQVSLSRLREEGGRGTAACATSRPLLSRTVHTHSHLRYSH